MKRLLIFLLLTSTATAETKATTSPSDALAWLIGDMTLLATTGANLDDYFYIWIPPWAGDDWDRAINWTMNDAASQSAVLIYPEILANGWLLRYDKNLLAPDNQTIRGNLETDRQRLDRVLYLIARQDFRFYLPTGDTIDVGEYEFLDGKKYSKVFGSGYAPWFDDPVLNALSQFELTLPANFVSADIFVDRGYSSINRGSYYDLLGIDFAPGEGKNSRDEYLKSFGISLQRSVDLRASFRAGLFISRVTKLERIVERVQGTVGELWRSLDRGRNNIRRVFQTFNNLQNDQHTFEEIFVVRRNGTIAKLISDREGNIKNSVPDDVANDYHATSGDSRIFAGASCLHCHSLSNSRHYNSVTHDLADLFSGFPTIVDDQSAGEKLIQFQTTAQAIERIGAEFGRVFEFELKLELARIKHSLNVRRITDVKRNATSIDSEKLGKTVYNMYNSVRHGQVDAERVLLEFGWIAGENPEAEFIEKFPIQADSPILTFQDIHHRALSRGKTIKFIDDFQGSYARLALSHKEYLSLQRLAANDTQKQGVE